ncbi:LacI family DNA-binding transcriptional regulator [Georgenia faecalis]|uniref:LacI family DNA-binding transcriptional regulator n=1 Tax=Georgenia faecalis TaxID=2483799 RepID=A0ABV9D4U5_9MICO|nr:LacI family DNA-binding transcriptional regulator [Georgenia faecalis]
MREPSPVRRATLAQVAELAGVSLKTASRALGGEPYVSDATRAQVLTAARSLDYQRNSAASLLASGRLSDSVSLITGDITNPFYSALAKGLEDAISERHMHLSVANARESAEQEWRLARSLADHQTKAIVVVSAMADHSPYKTLQARGIPVVFVDRPAEQVAADSVVLDNRGGGRTAATHLLGCGHRRIAFVGDYDWLPTHRERIAGMAEILDDAGVSGWRDLVRTGAHDAATARQHVRELLALPDPPTAFVAGNNQIVLGLVEELAAGAPASGRPAVIGFDDFEWARVLGITVVAHDAGEMGAHAARLALDRLRDREREIETVVLPMTLIARGSGELAPPA